MTSTMRPGQIDVNDLEKAILEHLVSQELLICEPVHRLHVLSREFTGVGSFTRFACEGSGVSGSEKPISLDALINIPGIPNGMGAVLFLKGGKPECLEIFTYGDLWDGIYDGFSIEPTA